MGLGPDDDPIDPFASVPTDIAAPLPLEYEHSDVSRDAARNRLAWVLPLFAAALAASLALPLLFRFVVSSGIAFTLVAFRGYQIGWAVMQFVLAAAGWTFFGIDSDGRIRTTRAGVAGRTAMIIYFALMIPVFLMQLALPPALNLVRMIVLLVALLWMYAHLWRILRPFDVRAARRLMVVAISLTAAARITGVIINIEWLMGAPSFLAQMPSMMLLLTAADYGSIAGSVCMIAAPVIAWWHLRRRSQPAVVS